MMSVNPAVVTNATTAPLRSSNALVATVVPWANTAGRSGTSPSPPSSPSSPSPPSPAATPPEGSAAVGRFRAQLLGAQSESGEDDQVRMQLLLGPHHRLQPTPNPVGHRIGAIPTEPRRSQARYDHPPSVGRLRPRRSRRRSRARRR